MRAYIIRHAEKEYGGHYNPRLRHQDEPITANGRRQAEKLCTYFADRPVAAIYVSGYQRTRQTAAYLAQRLGIEPVVDERLNEIDNGFFEGLSEKEIRERFPEVWQSLMAKAADFRFPGGETGEEARARSTSLLDEARREGHDTIFICHEGLIRLLTCHFMGLPVYARWNFQVDFCGILEVVAHESGQGWKLIRFNQVIL